MDDIATHAKRLVRPYVRSATAQAVIDSAKHLARIVATDPKLLEQHKRKVISLAQWFISEADGKYTTRYRSKAVVELAMNDPTSRIKINHEHVYGRGQVSLASIYKPEILDTLLDGVLGCIVTQDEHNRLSGTEIGWARYRLAGIEVLDMSTTPPTIANVA